MKKVAVGVAMVVTLMAVFAGVEVKRAQNYLKSVETFRQSASVSDIQDTAVKLNKSIVLSSAEMYCDVSLDKLSPAMTDEYLAFFAEDNRPQTLVNNLHGKVDRAIGEVPKFNSRLGIIPKVSEAKAQNTELNDNLQQLSKATTLDERSLYCLDVVNQINQAAFVQDLRDASSVRSLPRGQLDMYRSDIGRIKQATQEIKPPVTLQSQHDKLIAFMTKAEIDLTQSAGNPQLLATSMTGNVQELQKTLDQIKAANIDLASRPTEITHLAEQL